MTYRDEGKNGKFIPVVSVVIPSYNSAQYIRQCLKAIQSQNTKLPFEVLLIDSSNDGTEQIVGNEFSEVKLFHFQDRRSVGTARNIGVEEARGKVVLFVDTDCIVEPTWVEQMYAAIQNFKADGVCGSFQNGTPWSITGSIGFYLEFFRFLPHNGKPYTTLFLVGGNSGFRKEIFKYAHYNDKSVGDDFTFSWQLRNMGKNLLFLPSVSVKHINKTGLLNVLRYQYKLGSGACSYRNNVSPKIMRPLKTLPILSFLIPFGTMAWIGSTILKRCGILEFFKFVILLPFLYIANIVWATGFYRELKDQKFS